VKRGRPRGSGKKKLKILDYRWWSIEVNECFPSVNYIVRKKGDVHCAYCISLEEALKLMYDSLFLLNVSEKPGYGAKFEDLRNIIIKTKNEFASLFSADDFIKNSYKIVKTQTQHTEGDSLC